MYLAILIFHWMILPVHPIHISVSEVEITSGEISWTARIYTDDLLLGIYGKDADMTLLADQKKVKNDILTYLVRNISVTVSDNPLQWDLVDIQPDPEAIWTTIKSDIGNSRITSINISNNILLDVYKDQKNIVNISTGSVKKNIVFERGDGMKVVKF